LRPINRIGYGDGKHICQRGVFWPMAFEATVPECQAIGEIPKDVFGGFYRKRTCPAARRQGAESVFTTDGMVQVDGHRHR